MKRHRAGLLVTILLLLAATVVGGAAADASGRQQQRPLRVKVEFSAVPPDFECAGGLMPQGFVGGGQVSHLGAVEISGGVCNDFVNLRFTDGFGTYVAANGDSIDITYAGDATPTETGFLGEGSAEIVGGTGRFDGATGAFDFTTTTTVFPDGSSTTSLEGDGWITYGSRR